MLSGTACGFKYAKEEDMREVCDKCKQAYNGDWSIQDCDYCTFYQVVQQCKKLAWTLADLYE